MSEPVFTVANQLTILRMALAPFMVVTILSHEYTWALVLFVVAAVTDLLDGLIARLGHQQTTLGAMLDPIADKLLISSSFVALTWTAGLAVRIPTWLTVITLSRDAIIILTVTIINLALGRRLFYPSWLGKVTTLAQLLTSGCVLLLNALDAAGPGPVVYLFLATVALTVVSAFHYVYMASRPQPVEP